MLRRGVIYCATGPMIYLEAALISAIVLHHHEPHLPITLLSDHPLITQLPLAQFSISGRLIGDAEPDPYISRSIKTQLNHFSPYAETLFVDADILPLQPIPEIWQALDQGDWAMVPDRLPRVSLCDHVAAPEKAYTLQQLGGDAVQFNSGLILWRNTPTTSQLFEQWHQEWQKFRCQDQLALVRAIHQTQPPIVKLPSIYNMSPIDAASSGANVHLLHHWGGWSQQENSADRPRHVIPN